MLVVAGPAVVCMRGVAGVRCVCLVLVMAFARLVLFMRWGGMPTMLAVIVVCVCMMHFFGLVRLRQFRTSASASLQAPP